jgi:ribonuclease P protein component
VLKQNGFGAEFRLNTQANFQNVYKNAKKFRQGGISILTCQNQLTHSRIGISISKKQIPRAVDRNRIRRVIREYFRVQHKKLAVNIDMVFFAYSALLELNNLEITACLEVLWAKLISFYEKA